MESSKDTQQAGGSVVQHTSSSKYTAGIALKTLLAVAMAFQSTWLVILQRCVQVAGKGVGRKYGQFSHIYILYLVSLSSYSLLAIIILNSVLFIL